MIEIDITLNPFGEGTNKKKLCRIFIANVGGDSSFHNYLYMIVEKNPLVGKPIEIVGKVERYDRWSPVVDLVHRCLEDYRQQNYKSYVPSSRESYVIENWKKEMNE